MSGEAKVSSLSLPDVNVGIELEMCSRRDKAYWKQHLQVFRVVDDGSIKCPEGEGMPMEFVLGWNKGRCQACSKWTTVYACDPACRTFCRTCAPTAGGGPLSMAKVQPQKWFQHKMGLIVSDLCKIEQGCTGMQNETCGVHVHVSHPAATLQKDPNFGEWLMEHWALEQQEDMIRQWKLREHNRFCAKNIGSYDLERYLKYLQMNIKNSATQEEREEYPEFFEEDEEEDDPFMAYMHGVEGGQEEEEEEDEEEDDEEDDEEDEEDLWHVEFRGHAGYHATGPGEWPQTELLNYVEAMATLFVQMFRRYKKGEPASLKPYNRELVDTITAEKVKGVDERFYTWFNAHSNPALPGDLRADEERRLEIKYTGKYLENWKQRASARKWNWKVVEAEQQRRAAEAEQQRRAEAEQQRRAKRASADSRKRKPQEGEDKNPRSQTRQRSDSPTNLYPNANPNLFEMFQGLTFADTYRYGVLRF